uniref:Uncharacterized protein n=1 Tax=Panagrolaimus sp. JU765 TaxID=591449 RepID=A0AC34QJE4_9BILA
MFLKVSIFCILFGLVTSQCTDKKNNLVDIGDTTDGAYNAHFQNAVGATYDQNGSPACYKDSWLIGTVCENGKSKNPLIPDSDCKFALCANATTLCTALGTPGTHSLGEIEGDLGINGTIALPALSSAINGILAGKWKATLNIQSSGQTIASIKVPSNEKWIDINE